MLLSWPPASVAFVSRQDALDRTMCRANFRRGIKQPTAGGEAEVGLFRRGSSGRNRRRYLTNHEPRRCQPWPVGSEHGARSAAFRLGTRGADDPRRKCREFAPRSIDDAKKRGHSRHVGFVFRALPLVVAPSFRTDESLRRSSALRFVGHVQTVGLDLLVRLSGARILTMMKSHSDRENCALARH